jgi:hypothetical protein
MPLFTIDTCIKRQRPAMWDIEQENQEATFDMDEYHTAKQRIPNHRPMLANARTPA